MKAVDPVIASVIIVAVAIALSIAIALWMSGLVIGVTGVEKLEIVSSYAKLYVNKTSLKQWFNATLIIDNKGTKPATIDSIIINGKPYTSYDISVNITRQLPVTVEPGGRISISVLMDTRSFHHGQMVTIEIHTASGGAYPTTLTLP